MRKIIILTLCLMVLLCQSGTITAQVASYSGASSWAVEILDRADGYGLITDRIKDNVSKGVTREEFAELAVRLYEVYTGKTPSTAGITFTDTQNPQILKAAIAGLVSGVGGGKFAPNDLVIREEMATILLRTLKVINTFGNFDYSGVAEFSDDALLAS